MSFSIADIERSLEDGSYEQKPEALTEAIQVLWRLYRTGQCISENPRLLQVLDRLLKSKVKHDLNGRFLGETARAAM